MKKVLLMLALMTVVTGCSAQHQVPPSTTNVFSNPHGTGDAGTNSTANSVGNDGLDTSSDQATNSQMRKIAYTLTEQYINSHNDKTIDKYRADIATFLSPGIVKFVSQAASSGTDYNHPVQKYDINVSSVQFLDAKNFNAVAKCNVQYKGEASKQITYHMQFVNYQGDWLIRLIR